MSMVSASCHPSMQGWNVPLASHQQQNQIPPPRSYYVVSWVPRALPEVVQLIKEIPSEADRCLINKHFELGMLVMRRCGVQNPEEIKCLLDGFREGTTRLSSREGNRNDDNGKTDFGNAGSERRKLLIFFNDHRASRPWVLCPAKHCIKSARTTGKVKGRVKIFQYDHRTSSVKIPKLFSDCLSDFMTRDQYVFATFCPQQKYTDHEPEWFDTAKTGGCGESGGDSIFRDLVEEHDIKGSRGWPFEDYLIFSNSHAKIVAVFKKKQPLIAMLRNGWVPDEGQMATLSSMGVGNTYAGPPMQMHHFSDPSSFGYPVYNRGHVSKQEGYNDLDLKENNGLTAMTSTTASVGYTEEDEKGGHTSRLRGQSRHDSDEGTEEEGSDKDYGAHGSVPCRGAMMGQVPSPYGDCVREGEEAEHLLVRIMNCVLSRLEPGDDTSCMDMGYSMERHQPKMMSHDAPLHPICMPSHDLTYQRMANSSSSGNGIPDDLAEGRRTTTGGGSSLDGTDMGSNGVDALSDRRNKQDLDSEGRRRKALNYQPQPCGAVLYHELVRQFLSRLSFGLDHPPLPQKRIPDTVKRVVTKIVIDNIRDVNLALLTSTLRCPTDSMLSPPDDGSLEYERVPSSQGYSSYYCPPNSSVLMGSAPYMNGFGYPDSNQANGCGSMSGPYGPAYDVLCQMDPSMMGGSNYMPDYSQQYCQLNDDCEIEKDEGNALQLGVPGISDTSGLGSNDPGNLTLDEVEDGAESDSDSPCKINRGKRKRRKKGIDY